MELWAIEYQLVNSSPEYVFEWLKDNVADKHTLLSDDRSGLEIALKSREENLIDLGLALYGETPSIGYLLYQTGDPVIKRAALSGRSVRPLPLDKSWALNDDVIPKLLTEEIQTDKSKTEGDETTLLHELLQNKFLPSEILEAVYEKAEPFSGINDELWIDLIGMTARNERLSIPYNSTWIDGFDEFLYNAVFAAAWRLFNKLPVNRKSAVTLNFLSERLVPDAPFDMEAFEVIDRWRSDDPEEDKIFSYVRSALVKIIRYPRKLKELKNHDDLALRRGYYANLSWAKPSDVTDGFEKDGIEFLDSALFNDSFFTREDTRSALKEACWNAPDEHSRLDYPNYFNSRVEDLSSEHPEWFKDDWTGDLPFDEIIDPEERREKRLEQLNLQVGDLHKALLGDKDEYQEANQFGENSILNHLKFELQQIGEHLGRLYQKSTFSWGWLAAGLALGFIFGKY